MITYRLTLQTVPIERLVSAPYNPRVELKPGMPGYERLKRSLEEFDLVQPIVWNRRTGHVVSGHQRLDILKRDGVTELDVAVVDLPLAREQALNVTLNNARVGGDWEPSKLLELLNELENLPELDATLTGFDVEELNQLLLRPDPDFSPDDGAEEKANTYRVTFEIEQDDWESFRPVLDRFLAEHDLTPHIRPPR